MEVYHMLFERCHTKNGKRSIKQHIKYFNFRGKVQLDHPVELTLEVCLTGLYSVLLFSGRPRHLRRRGLCGRVLHRHGRDLREGGGGEAHRRERRSVVVSKIGMAFETSPHSDSDVQIYGLVHLAEDSLLYKKFMLWWKFWLIWWQQTVFRDQMRSLL